MKKVLIVGATGCFLIGLCSLISVIIEFIEGSNARQDLLRNPNFLFFLLIEASVAFLFFAPGVILYRGRNIEMSRSRLIFAGVLELIALVLFIAMSFPAL